MRDESRRLPPHRSRRAYTNSECYADGYPMSPLRLPVLAALLATASACGAAQPVEAVWLMPTMEGGPGATDPRGLPFVYTRGRGVRGGDTAQSHPDDAHPGDLPETMLTSAQSYWNTDEQLALAKARESGRGVVIQFYADWCDACRFLEGDTLRDHDVRAAILERYVPLRIDVTEETFETRDQLERYRVLQLPAIILIDEQGKERDRIESYVPAEAMLQRLGDARTATRQRR